MAENDIIDRERNQSNALVKNNVKQHCGLLVSIRGCWHLSHAYRGRDVYMFFPPPPPPLETTFNICASVCTMYADFYFDWMICWTSTRLPRGGAPRYNNADRCQFSMMVSFWLAMTKGEGEEMWIGIYRCKEMKARERERKRNSSFNSVYKVD